MRCGKYGAFVSLKTRCFEGRSRREKDRPNWDNKRIGGITYEKEREKNHGK